MNLINIENLTKSYTERKLFNGASFSLQEGEKVGVIGINGTGKTTLLKMIMGEEETDEGTVTLANHVVLRYLPQHPEFAPDKSSLECVLEGNVTDENRWSIESEAKAMMTRLGIKDFMQPAGQLSGGQRKRLALISVLLSPADILLLDEPTNHLDYEMADWLEDYLKKWRGALIMVTHDRYFLDSVTNRIIEIDKGLIYSYQTNYSGYLELKTQRQEMELATERKRQSILRVELEWIRRGARARSTKQKAHIQRYEELRDRQAPVQDSQVELSSISTRLGKTTVELEHICKAYGEKKLIDDFSYIFLKGDRVGFVGPNGCGKSTLMNALTAAGVLAEDRLFATLDPTARTLRLPDGREVLLVDTVGLVRRLPHQLVEAFHSTLEEAAQADAILNVCDAASPEAEEQLQLTEDLLRELRAEEADRPEPPTLRVYNKCDLLGGPIALGGRRAVAISAATGAGLTQLLDTLAAVLPPDRRRVQVLIPFREGALAERCRRQGAVEKEQFTPEGVQMTVTLGLRELEAVRPYLMETPPENGAPSA